MQENCKMVKYTYNFPDSLQCLKWCSFGRFLLRIVDFWPNSQSLLYIIVYLVIPAMPTNESKMETKSEISKVWMDMKSEKRKTTRWTKKGTKKTNEETTMIKSICMGIFLNALMSKYVISRCRYCYENDDRDWHYRQWHLEHTQTMGFICRRDWENVHHQIDKR